MKDVTIEIGLGEAMDRWSILEIKIKKLNGEKQSIAHRELNKLKQRISDSDHVLTQELFEEYKNLVKVNSQLWRVEDELRELEPIIFGVPDITLSTIDAQLQEWINLARSVYKLNDERYRIKNLIDTNFGGGTHEVKSYA